MKRTTIEKPASEMNMVELAHNCMYAKDGWAWYRDYDSDMDLRDFIRRFSEAEGSELPDDNETLDDILMDNLQYGINDQCTGLMDKNDKLIWENEKCLITKPCTCVGVHIVFKDGCFWGYDKLFDSLIKLCDLKVNSYEIEVVSKEPKKLFEN